MLLFSNDSPQFYSRAEIALVSYCVSYFSCHTDKMADRIKEGRAPFGSQFEGTVHHGGEGMETRMDLLAGEA